MQQHELEPCPKCGGERVEVKFVTVGNAPLVVIQPLHNKKKLMRKQNESSLVTYTCTHCGYIESYARTPENLRPDT